MNKFDTVKEWFQWAYIEQKSSKPICTELAHFSFYNKDDDRITMLKKSIQVFNSLIEISSAEGILSDMMPIMVISLKCSEDSLVLLDKDKFILENEFDKEMYFPEIIYLVERNIARYYEKIEEYKCDIEIQLPLSLHQNCKVYYRCWRDAISINNNWLDFERAIYIKHYPDSLLEFNHD